MSDWRRKYFDIANSSVHDTGILHHGFIGLAFIAMREGDYDGACEHVERALDILVPIIPSEKQFNSDELARLYVLQAVILSLAGKSDKARRSLRLAYDRAESDILRIQIDAAVALP